ncbi:hypothetical protein BAE44_0019119 [Dichanthelium oligosanthes]|uniref:Reverse transcriptase zinc-binding domain-containing protein n=1 Tax=Dichanthelium oligosanthes TaxID=888268 RepID=A0A1E5V3Y9_9POAL|nr:hypothetical protein BAE44_0019119 [Dichanthelium oligosanthes]
MQHFESLLLVEAGNKENKWRLFIFAGVSWAIWRTRNDWVFSNILVKSPKTIAYRALGFLQYWKQLGRSEEQLKMTWVLEKLQEGLMAW